MKLPDWLKRRPQDPNQHPELPPPLGPRREFVYLDEVSVISLVASRRGEVPEAVTRSESARDSAELNAKIAGNVGVVKSEIGSKLATEASRGVTTVAKSIVQTTFKDLRQIEDDNLLLRVPPPGDAPNVQAADDLLRVATKPEAAGWVVGAAELYRGCPFEVEIELTADPLFRTTTAISEVLSLMGDMGDLVPGVSAQEIADMERLATVLERLLAGLVPIRGRMVDYRLVVVRGCELVVHSSILDRLGLSSRELSVVGVASRDLFWKDLRRVMFSDARYTVFCRMSRTGVQRNWNPVKLAEALREVAPQLEDQMQQLGPMLQNSIRSGAAGEPPAGGRDEKMRKALILYAQAAAATVGATVLEADLEGDGLLSEGQCGRHGDVLSQRDAFKAVNDELRSQFQLELSSDQALGLRQDALARTGLVDRGDEPAPTAGTSSAPPDERLLEVEPVAIYW